MTLYILLSQYCLYIYFQLLFFTKLIKLTSLQLHIHGGWIPVVQYISAQPFQWVYTYMDYSVPETYSECLVHDSKSRSRTPQAECAWQ